MPEVKDGYPGLSHLMGHDEALGIFKRFSALNSRNLLYMQAELLDLELQLDAFTESDDKAQTDSGSSRYARSAAELRASLHSENKSHRRQWQLMLEARNKLKEYNKALLLYSKISRLDDAAEYDFNVLRDWLKHHFQRSSEARLWKKDEFRDLKHVARAREFDPSIRFLSYRVVPWLYDKLMYRFKKVNPHGLPEWSDKSYHRLARLIAVLISTLFPLVAVIVLYFIHDLAVRLWAVLCFSMVFSSVLAVFTTARPIEIFAATAACASVQVVFVGSTDYTGKQ